MPEVLSPREWRAIVDYDSWNDPFTPDEGVVLHHGGGSDYLAARTADPADEIQQLQQWEGFHLYGRGWRGLAYGWAVGQSGTIYRIRGWNRYGAHLGDIDGDGIANNEELIPIIWIASGNHHTVSAAADESISWLRRNVIEDRSPKATKLYGHQEVQLNKPTACPGPNGMVYVRSHRLLERLEMVQGPNGEPFWDEVSDFARNSWSWAHEAGILSDASHPGDTLTKEEFMVHLKRYHGSVQGALQSGGISEHRVKELIEADTTHLRAGRPIVGRNA